MAISRWQRCATAATIVGLYDATGRMILSKNMTISTEEIDTAHLPEGSYLLKLVHNGETQTQKILILH